MTQEDITRMQNIARDMIREDKESSTSQSDVDDEQSVRYAIAKLGPNSDNIMIINKINEIINDFNKSLIDNRI